MPTNGLPSLILALIAASLLVLCVWQWRRLRGLEQSVARATEAPAAPPPQGNLFAQVGDSVHEVVVLYKDVILYANPMFARLVGVDRVDLVGRQLPELVEGEARWHFAVDKAAEISATVRDMAGNVVYTHQGSVGQGESIFTWDGIGSSGNKLPDGSYSITIEGRDGAGRLVNVATEMTGRVTGVDLAGSEPVLIVGTARVNMSSVLSVRAEVPEEPEA